MNKAKVKAYKVSEAAMKANRMLNYGEICDGERQIVPINMRPMHGYDGYQVLEDINGGVYIIKNKDALSYKLDKRPLGEPKTNYMAPPNKEKNNLTKKEKTDKLLEETNKPKGE